MGYLAVWKTLEELIADFRKKRRPVPIEVMNNLKSARTVIRISKADECYGEAVQKIEEYLANLEAYLISEGQKAFGSEYADEWLKRLNEARKRLPEKEEEETRFISGMPRGQKWIRVNPLEELSSEKLKMLAQQSEVTYKAQADGSLLVYGSNESVKDFIRKMTESQSLKLRRQKQKTTCHHGFTKQ
jgi:hypothetical protein